MTEPITDVKQNIVVLVVCQTFLLAISSTVVSVSSLVGQSLAGNKLLSSLPVTAFMLGAAVTTYPASLYMKRAGRRAGFRLGACSGLAGSFVAALAVSTASFPLLCLGTLLLGSSNGIGQYYRFAAADASPAGFKSTAISLVMTGGLVGGLLGPSVSRFTVELFSQRFLGAYLALAGYLMLALLILGRLKIAAPSGTAAQAPGRPLSEIVRQPEVLIAIVSAAMANGVMVLLMVATPLAMSFCHHPYAAATSVIGWHFIGMFGPSLITGRLIHRFGTVRIMLVGTLVLFASVAVALTGSSVSYFWVAMFLLGIGWNLIYIGGTTLLSESCHPDDKAKSQGLNDLAISVWQVVSSIFSGALVNSGGWHVLNYISLLFTTLIVAGLLWLVWKRSAHAVTGEV
ncbi:MAG: MFS transporter [Desulfuromonadaceae bacterium]